MSKPSKPLAKRPNGGSVMKTGWALIIIGMLAAIVFVAVDDDLQSLIVAGAISSIGVGFGTLLVALGYLARAIYFLPGRDVTEAELLGDAPDKRSTSCDWCGQDVMSPNRPCSQVPAPRLAEIANEIIDSECRQQLVARGIIASGTNESRIND